MSPDSREIESVGGNSSASRRSLRFYFSFEAILEEVIRARLNGREDEGLLPPRKFWSRPSRLERDKGLSPRAARRMAIRRRVMLELKRGTLVEQPWGVKLMAFVRRIQDAVFTSQVSFTAPRIIRIVKGTDEEGRKTFREVASFDSLADRVILNRMTAYLRDAIEPILSASCYSFRSNGRITHESAIGDLQSWRAAHADRTMYVAECDIRKFFDSIAHESVLQRWREVFGADGEAGSLSLSESEIALRVVQAYLEVYSVPNCPGCGLPQGGSLSVVLANLVLSAADDAVLAERKCDLFYARYCDDVVIAATDREACAAALERYAKSLDELRLPMHEPEDFVYRPTGKDVKGDEYFTTKSKRPFLWAEAAKEVPGVAPWVNFLGSQVRFDGATRIRKESIKRHQRALGRVTANAVREVQSETFAGLTVAEVKAWYGRFRNRLIASGVGYVTEKVEDCFACWAGAFGRVTPCAETQRQMRVLDRVREGMLCKVWHLVSDRIGKGARRFKGRPFSYHAFLMKVANRPTNLRGRHAGHVARIAYG